MLIQPFQIQVPQTVLDNLKERLLKTQWPEELRWSGWEVGPNLHYMRELAEYWIHQFDWRRQERELNRLHHFKALIQGVSLHFVYEFGRGPQAGPLLLAHGWRDSFYRFHKMIPRLTGQNRPDGTDVSAFDVVIPSLPGHGFSDQVTLPAETTAELWAQLMMEGLGYKAFKVAASNPASPVVKALLLKYPETVTQVTWAELGVFPPEEEFPCLTRAEQKFTGFFQPGRHEEGACTMLQAVQLLALGQTLDRSPLDLAAWTIEKLFAGSGCRGHIEHCFSKDELLTHVMIPWVTRELGTQASAMAPVPPSVHLETVGTGHLS